MEEEKNELNDIILNKSGSAGGNKKIILAVATLGVILIIVVMLMSTLTPDAKDNLPQPIPLPLEQTKSVTPPQEEPLFEEVEVIEENTQKNNNLDEIAQRLKQESIDSAKVTKPKEPEVVITPKKPVPEKVVVTKKETPKVKTSATGTHYVQVGSFSRYEPNKKFLKSITDKGFTYKYHKVTKNSKTLNKVLIGPFNSKAEAKKALKTIKSSIEAGAFIVQL